MPLLKASPQTIWSVPVYLPYLQPKLTDSRLQKAEEKLGYRLPKELVALLKEQNGGYIRFSLPDSPHSLIAGIGPHFPSLLDFDWEEVREFVDFPLDGLIPFDGDGHWHICLDYRKNPKNPSVVFIDIELNEESPIAKNFAEYLKKLIWDVEEEFVFWDLKDIPNFLSQIAGEMKAKWEEPNVLDFGYPIYRARLGKKNQPEWIWFSPNEVPKGFVRSQHKDAEKLSKKGKGKAKRYPQLPKNSYLLNSTPGIREKLREILKKHNYPIQTLKEWVSA